MFGSEALEVGIGLIFVYLLLSLACTAGTELIAGLLRLRANTLRRSIAHLLNDPNARGLAQRLSDAFYDHPMIRSLYAGGKGPSYIPARTFAMTLMDLLAKQEATAAGKPVSGDELLKLAGAEPGSSPMNDVLRVLVREAREDVDRIQENLEIWYNNAMDRVSGWYKRRVQMIGLVVALVLTFAADADTLQIARSLSQDSALRAAVAQQAETFGEQAAESLADAGADTSQIARAVALGNTAAMQLEQTGLPLGWQEGEFGGWMRSFVVRPSRAPMAAGALAAAPMPVSMSPLSKLFGLLITTLAVSLGAPFWFDVLNKVVAVRAAGKSPEEVAKRPEARAKRPEEVPPK